MFMLSFWVDFENRWLTFAQQCEVSGVAKDSIMDTVFRWAGAVLKSKGACVIWNVRHCPVCHYSIVSLSACFTCLHNIKNKNVQESILDTPTCKGRCGRGRECQIWIAGNEQGVAFLIERNYTKKAINLVYVGFQIKFGISGFLLFFHVYYAGLSPLRIWIYRMIYSSVVYWFCSL